MERSHAAFKSCFGRINPDCIPILFGPWPAEDSLAIAGEMELAFRKIVRAWVPLVPGIAGLLTARSNSGARLGVGSSGPPENVNARLGGRGLTRFFATTVDGSQVVRGKPAPDVFLIGAERTGVTPAASSVIEAAPVGIPAGVAAGMLGIGVPTAHPGDDLRAAAHVCPEPSAIDPVALVAMPRARAAGNV